MLSHLKLNCTNHVPISRCNCLLVHDKDDTIRKLCELLCSFVTVSGVGVARQAILPEESLENGTGIHRNKTFKI